MGEEKKHISKNIFFFFFFFIIYSTVEGGFQHKLYLLLSYNYNKKK